MEHKILNSSFLNEGYILNIFIRERNQSGKHLFDSLDRMKQLNNIVKNESIEKVDAKTENFHDTFNEVMIKFENNEVTPSWNSHKSFKYSFKGNFDFFNNTIRDFKNYRDNNNALNKNVLTKKYTFDEYNPLVVENVFCDSFEDDTELL